MPRPFEPCCPEAQACRNRWRQSSYPWESTTPYAPLTASPALTAVPYPLAGPYLTVPAGVYQARVTPTGTKTVAIDSGRLALQGNTVRTVVALDPSSQGGPFELLVLPDVN